MFCSIRCWGKASLDVSDCIANAGEWHREMNDFLTGTGEWHKEVSE